MTTVDRFTNKKNKGFIDPATIEVLGIEETYLFRESLYSKVQKSAKR
jgi:hypothetical protein